MAKNTTDRDKFLIYSFITAIFIFGSYHATNWLNDNRLVNAKLHFELGRENSTEEDSEKLEEYFIEMNEEINYDAVF